MRNNSDIENLEQLVTLARARKLFRQFRGSIGGNFVNPVTKFECEVSLFTLNNPNARFRNALSAAVGGKRQDYVRVCGWKTSAVTLKIEVCFFFPLCTSPENVTRKIWASFLEKSRRCPTKYSVKAGVLDSNLLLPYEVYGKRFPLTSYCGIQRAIKRAADNFV